MRLLAVLALALLAACSSPTGTKVTGGVTIDTIQAKVPNQDVASTLDMGTWNLEWFGSTGNGPTDEVLQAKLVRSILAGLNLDLIGVQEVVSQSAFDLLVAALPGYDGFIAGEAGVAGGPGSYSASEQKVGLIYRSSVATLTGAKIVLTANDTDFAGRPPLEATFRITVNGVTEDLVVLVIHMKAFADAESWQRRVNASTALKAYLDTTHPTARVIVLGDWNDDVDTSISSGRASPYANFLADPARYTFPTLVLSLAGVFSTIGFPDVVDHQLVTNELATLTVSGSTKAIRLDQLVAGYADHVTDHLPVVTSYRMR